MRLLVATVIAVCLSLASAQDPQTSTPVGSESLIYDVFTHPAMATEFEFILYGRPGDTHPAVLRQIVDEAFAAIDDLENRISNWKENSQVSYINRHAAQGPVKAAPDVIDLIAYSKEVYELTGGAFDISVGPILELWGFYRKEGRIPSPREIEAALAKVGMNKVTVDKHEGTVRFAAQGMSLDFGGIGKGLALDQAAKILRRNGITSALLSGGTSSILAIGTPPGEPHWTVHVRNPYNEEQPIDTLPLSDAAFSTSGCYGPMIDVNGRQYCHIVDPRTGLPIEGVLSVSVITKTAIEGDALDTGFLVMGRKKVESYCREHPEVGVVYVEATQDDSPKPVRINIEREAK